MKRQGIAFPAVVAVAASTLTTAVWMTIAPASAGVADLGAIKALQYREVDGSPITVDPGTVSDTSVACPSKDWDAISGGYVMVGIDGLTVASATASYPGNSFSSWHVTVANPKVAASPVTFRARVQCMTALSEQVPG